MSDEESRNACSDRTEEDNEETNGPNEMSQPTNMFEEESSIGGFDGADGENAGSNRPSGVSQPETGAVSGITSPQKEPDSPSFVQHGPRNVHENQREAGAASGSTSLQEAPDCPQFIQQDLTSVDRSQPDACVESGERLLQEAPCCTLVKSELKSGDRNQSNSVSGTLRLYPCGFLYRIPDKNQFQRTADTERRIRLLNSSAVANGTNQQDCAARCPKPSCYEMYVEMSKERSRPINASSMANSTNQQNVITRRPIFSSFQNNVETLKLNAGSTAGLKNNLDSSDHLSTSSRDQRDGTSVRRLPLQLNLGSSSRADGSGQQNNPNLLSTKSRVSRYSSIFAGRHERCLTSWPKIISQQDMPDNSRGSLTRRNFERAATKAQEGSTSSSLGVSQQGMPYDASRNLRFYRQVESSPTYAEVLKFSSALDNTSQQNNYAQRSEQLILGRNRVRGSATSSPFGGNLQVMPYNPSRDPCICRQVERTPTYAEECDPDELSVDSPPQETRCSCTLPPGARTVPLAPCIASLAPGIASPAPHIAPPRPSDNADHMRELPHRPDDMLSDSVRADIIKTMSECSKHEEVQSCTDSENSVDICAICCVEMEEIEDDRYIRRLECTHMFHLLCIDQWLELNGTCPLCRCKIQKSSDAEDFSHSSTSEE